MVDKFGSSREKRIILTKIRQDLDMRDHRITNLGMPENSSDAVTRRWVNQQFKDSAGEIEALQTKLNHMTMELKRVEREHAAAMKGLEKDIRDKVGKAECVSTNGGKMSVDLDMQNHAIRNLPEGTSADEPITKGWYAKNWQDLVNALQGRINAVDKNYDTLEKQMFDNQDRIDSMETFVKLKHPTGVSTTDKTTTGRSKRTRATEDVVESGRVAIEALERKIDSLLG